MTVRYVEKALFRPLTKPDGSVLSGGGEEFFVSFNPETLKLSLENKTKEGSNDQPAQQKSDTVGKLSMTLIFDTTSANDAGGAEGSDVREMTAVIAGYMNPSLKELVPSPGDRRLQNPILVSFEWGSFQYTGFVDKYEETLDFFDPAGVPLRASVQVTLKYQAVQNPGRSDLLDSADATKNQVMDRLFNVELPFTDTFTGFSPDPASNRKVAEDNGVEDPANPNGDDEAGSQENDAEKKSVLAKLDDIVSSVPTGFAAGGGFGFGAGIGLSAGVGIGIGMEAGIGIGVGGGFGVSGGAGIGLSPGAGVGVGFGASAGVGLSAGAGTGTGFGASAGAGLTASAGAGLSASAGAGFGASAGFSAGAANGAATGFSAGATAGAGLGGSGAAYSTAFNAGSSITGMTSGFSTAGGYQSGAAYGVVRTGASSTPYGEAARWQFRADPADAACVGAAFGSGSTSLVAFAGLKPKKERRRRIQITLPQEPHVDIQGGGFALGGAVSFGNGTKGAS